jgi:hypothetical protein
MTTYYCTDKDCNWEGTDPNWEGPVDVNLQVPVCPECGEDADVDEEEETHV